MVINLKANETLQFIRDHEDQFISACFSLGGGTKKTNRFNFKNKLAEIIPELHDTSWKSIEEALYELNEINIIKPLPGSSYSHDIYLFFPKNHTIFTISNIIYVNSYFAHYTALSLNQLTVNQSNTIYLKKETKLPPLSKETSVDQKTIDIVFSKPMRKSREITEIYWNNTLYRIIYLEGYILPKDNNDILFKDINIRYSGIERTLIDCVIRPAYSGGISSVLEAFRAAKETLDITKMATLINELNHFYPYERNIALYMKFSNFSEEQIQLFLSKVKKIEVNYNFYLDYQMLKKRFDSDLKIYYPYDIYDNAK